MNMKLPLLFLAAAIFSLQMPAWATGTCANGNVITFSTVSGITTGYNDRLIIAGSDAQVVVKNAAMGEYMSDWGIHDACQKYATLAMSFPTQFGFAMSTYNASGNTYEESSGKCVVTIGTALNFLSCYLIAK